MDTPPSKLTDEEKAKIRAHLLFPVIDGRVALGLGLPISTPTSYALDSAVERVLPQGVHMVRRCLRELECLDARLSQAGGQTAVTSVAGVLLRPRESIEDIQDLQHYWRARLGDSLGCPLNPLNLTELGGALIVIDPC